ncbi:MAG TPA: sterol desaturase family protein [Cyclobacteriaceae bacterium]|nr:sterol desaturase family protein [Cyclobacteriaceae bacterium]
MEQFIITHARELHLPNLFNYMAPVMIILALAEWGLSIYHRNDAYDTKDTLAGFTIGIVNLLIIGVIKLGFISLLIFIYNLTPLKIQDTWYSFIICIILFDFAGYWAHRVSHENRFFWATHVTHHSSEKFNLSVSVRNSWTGHVKLIFFIPIMFLGFHPLVFLISQQIYSLYQFWVHTEYIGKLPRIIEFIFITPSHHRVHHASNAKYLDRNYGVVLIIWDRIFGTFEEEYEKPKYGLTKPVNSYNPIYLNFHEWLAIFRDVRNAGSFRHAWQMIFSRPDKIDRIKQEWEETTSNQQNQKYPSSRRIIMPKDPLPVPSGNFLQKPILLKK